MRCSVQHCRNTSANNIEEVAFFSFPVNLNALHHWVAATGCPNFVPTFSAKICSKHFKADAYLSSGKLKQNAIPTLHLKLQNDGAKQGKGTDNLKTVNRKKETNPLSCILNPETAINDVKLVQESGMTENVNINESSGSQSVIVSQSHKVMNIATTTAGSNNLTLNFGHNSVSSSVSSSTCFVPVQLNIPLQFLQMQMQGVQMQGVQMQGVQMQGMRMVSPVMPALTPLPINASQQTSVSRQDNVQAKGGPIKLVDVNKLLKSPPKAIEKPKSKLVPIPLADLKNINKSKDASGKGDKHLPKDSSHVTVSHVLNCLKFILPGNFDLSRLIPNEKVSTLVIKYLDLVDNYISQNTIKMNLKIIVEAAKTREKVFDDDLFHPYLKINDKALQVALNKVLPSNFSMTDVSNQILGCICVTLKQEVYTDGYHILRGKIRKFTKEGQKFDEIINQVTEKNSPDKKHVVSAKEKIKKNQSTNGMLRENDNHVVMSNSTNSLNKTQVHKSQSLSCATKIEESSEEENEANSESLKRLESRSENAHNRENTKKQRTGALRIVANKDDINDPSYDPSTDSSFSLEDDTGRIRTKSKQGRNKDFCPDNNKTDIAKGQDSELKRVMRLKTIVNYLEEKQCSAKEVLSSFRLMFFLCRYLHIKSKHSNLQKLKTILTLIMERKINKSNVRQLEEELFPELKPSIKRQLSKSKPITEIKDDKKLLLKPVVILHNITDYGHNNLLFMTGRKKGWSKCNGYGYHSQRVPFCFQQALTLKKFSSETVRKLTNESYKCFRRIIMKKDGNKVVFRLKYNKLNVHSVVFVKDFRNPAVGWVKGTVKKTSGPLKYLVELSSGETWWCFAGQLRPLPHSQFLKQNSRTPRQVKPKQLFDL